MQQIKKKTNEKIKSVDAGLSQQVSKGLIICIKHVVRSLNEPGKNDCVRVMTLYSKQETL